MVLALVAVAIALVLLIACLAFQKRKRPWPFKALKPRGTHQSAPLPGDDKGLEERKRDFARIVSPTSAKPGLFVVTPTAATPTPWTSAEHTKGDVSVEVANAVFEEFSTWLQSQASSLRDDVAEGLNKRVVSMVAVSEGFGFAMKQGFPPMFPQAKYVLVLSSSGEVRVIWLAYATDAAKANMTSTPFILKLGTQDLNNEKVAAESVKDGVKMDYVVVHTSETDLDRYVRQKQAAALSRAAVENCWDEIFSEV
eukprot:gnl/TRDRNA2_/TRDRNA2_191025_c0_seq1.p1 gnl/TRDRNA2_/TRDRNA2_191025_c0~~gnl/TRDRNA2_/TRDRNA2_191025_c0_seq1.p1  ORF type:complete len:253 (+),score=51.61 gnl/TRDRNA2_/TRDRNA2_191025_c0_seq1:64-822(+)